MSAPRQTRELLAEINDLLVLLDDALDDADAPADFHLDGDGRVLDVSERAAGWLDVTRSALVGRPLGTVADVQGQWDPGERIELQRGGRRFAGTLETHADGTAGILALRLGPVSAETADISGLRLLVHDLANVLGVIRGHAELTRLLADEAVTEAMDEILEAVARGEVMLQQAQTDAGDPGAEDGR